MEKYVWIRVVTPEWEYTERMGPAPAVERLEPVLRVS